MRIAIIGPESTGKSTLAQQLAWHYKTVFVPEMARTFINNLSVPYHQNDLLKIAQLQIKAEDQLAREANAILICDTSLLVIKIWSEFKYGNCDSWILNETINRQYDAHLLCNIDLPWEEDAQREHPEARQLLFDIYHSELIKMKVNYEIISGKQTERLKRAIQAINKIIYC